MARKPKPSTAGQDAETPGGHALTVSRPELLVDGSDHAFRTLIHDALAFTGRLQAIRDGYAAIVSVTGVQYTILVCVSVLQARQSVTVKAIADHLKLSGPFVTAEVGKLVAQGLLEKNPDPIDRRRVSLRLTDEARRRLGALAPVQRQVNDVHFGGLSASDFEHLARMMHELVETTDRGLALLDYLSPGGKQG